MLAILTAICLWTVFGEAIEIVIPPSITAVLSLDAARDPTPRDKHIVEIRDKGRLAWQVSSGYNHRSRGEAQMGRWKMVIGPKLKAWNFPNQKTEARIGTHILNKNEWAWPCQVRGCCMT